MTDLRSLIAGTTQVAAVIGDPIEHSRSPVVHNAAFAHLGLDWAYVALPVAAGDGGDAVEAARVLGLRGLSVTMPHKASVAATVDRRTSAVELLEACNCVVRDGDEMVGHNTDGAGFVRSLLAETGADLATMKVCVAGAGGAGLAVLHALVEAGSASVSVVNRTPTRAEEAVAKLPQVQLGTEADLADADLVVNATAAGMAGGPAPDELPFSPDLLRADQIVADIVYQPAVTPLLAAAESVGAATVGGIGMLVYQAAIQFELWTGCDAPIDVMTAAIQSHN